MRKSLLLVTIPIVFGVLALAQISDDEFKTMMQSNGAAMMAINNATDQAAAAAAANKLVDEFTKVAAYWKAKNVPDAVTFAETARDAAKDIADGKGDKAANAMKIQQQCGGCHMAHRAGGRGNFSFK
jgi:mono/diheme cytochrome c family protein